MGMPSVMKKKQLELREKHPELVEATQPVKVMIPIDAPVAPANEGGDSSLEAPVSVVEEEAPLSLDQQWKLKFEQQEERFRSLKGTIESLEPTLRSERELRQKLETELQNLREAMPKPPVVLDPSEELTEEELEVYGSSAPVIQKIAKKIAKGELSGALKDLRKEIDDLKQANARVQTDLTQTSEQQFLAHVKSVIKNFDGITASTEWSEYLGKKLPYSKKTIYDALSEAHADRDLDTIKEVFDGFKPTKSALARMTSPALNGGAAPISTNGTQKPRMKLSDKKKISEDFLKGRLPKTELDKWNALFREAEAEGRLDLDK